MKSQKFPLFILAFILLSIPLTVMVTLAYRTIFPRAMSPASAPVSPPFPCQKGLKQIWFYKGSTCYSGYYKQTSFSCLDNSSGSFNSMICIPEYRWRAMATDSCDKLVDQNCGIVIPTSYPTPTSVPLSGAYKVTLSPNQTYIQCYKGDTNCYLKVGYFAYNHLDKPLYNTTMWTSNYLNTLSYIGFDGNWTTGMSKTTMVVNPGQSAPSTVVKITPPNQTGRFTSTLYIDGQTCSTSTSCFYYGGTKITFTVEVLKAPTPTPTRAIIPTPTPTPAAVLPTQSPPLPTVSLTRITVRAAGTQLYGVYPIMDLKVGKAVVKRWSDIRGDPAIRQFNDYIYMIPTASLKAGTKIRVAFINDAYIRGTGDRNLRIDGILIGDLKYESENPNIYSTGTWTLPNGCDWGFKKSEWLHCNGELTFYYGPL